MKILVQIIGAKVACPEGLKDSWRDVAKWTASQLKSKFGETVEVHYFDLFDTDCPPMPNNAQLPLVLVEGKMISNGEKISIPLIRKRIEEIFERDLAHQEP